jgi:phosphatidylglycerophosphate synthase
VLVAFVAGAIGEPASPWLATSAAAAALAVTIMDGVDGWMARRSRMASRFGARFDMEIDALLILALAILTWQQGKAGAWVVLSGLLRYGFMAVGWLLPRMRRPLPDSRRRQAICVVQVAALIIALEPFVTPPASALIASAALAALVYSFAVDTMWLLRTPGRPAAASALRASASLAEAKRRREGGRYTDESRWPSFSFFVRR